MARSTLTFKYAINIGSNNSKKININSNTNNSNNSNNHIRKENHSTNAQAVNCKLPREWAASRVLITVLWALGF